MSTAAVPANITAATTTNVAVEDDLGAIDRALRSMSATQISRFLAPKLRDYGEVLLVGGGKELVEPLHLLGKKVTISAATGPATLSDDAVVVWAGRSFVIADYEPAKDLRERFPGRVRTVFELLAGAALFQAVGHLVTYHLEEEKLVSFLTGTAPTAMANMDRFEEHIRGKRVIEFGPLDGAMTAGLVHLGAAEVSCVEIRMVNVLKMLANAHSFGWSNVRMILEDMHMVDANRYGRFDFVVAHGVYYHSAAPFAFLENICTLADTIFLGGFCAVEGRLREPLIELSHKGHVYRAQPFKDPLANDGAGVHPLGHYFMVDDLKLWMDRAGFDVEVLDLVETAANKNAGLYLRALCTRR